jgi:hypothetical protein
MACDTINTENIMVSFPYYFFVDARGEDKIDQ